MKHLLVLLSCGLMCTSCNLVEKTMTLTSPVFAEGEAIPLAYTCEGENTSPPLVFNNVPLNTKSLAITMMDPDVPKELKPEGYFDHWVVFNVPGDTASLTAKSPLGTPGTNGTGQSGYIGPCPPADHEPKEHRYVFTLYAFKAPLRIETVTRAQIEAAATQEILISKAVLTGRYQKQGK
jgi:Raf kinase inhibitor-like YbhB/YbcL family protein